MKVYLTQFREQLEPKPKDWKPTEETEKWPGRKAGSYKWYEIQDNIAYWLEFELPKIIYQEISTFHAFAWDSDGAYANNKCFIIPDANYYLLGLLNSAVVWWFLGNIVSKLRGGAYAMQASYISQIPIPGATSEQQAVIEELVEQTLGLKKENPNADVSALEAEIDQRVYMLYGLNEEEIAMVESVGFTPKMTKPLLQEKVIAGLKKTES